MASDPRGTAHLLSIGASEFPDRRYGRRPTVAGSARKLAEALAGNGVWELRQDSAAVLTGEVSKRLALEALKKAAKEPVDLLVVYLGCHGKRFENQRDELQLALSDADFDLFSTHLPFSQIKEMLRRATAPRRLLLLDCCYADDSFLGTVRDIPALQVTGVCTLSATEYREEAIADWKDTGCTAFAGALIEILDQGIPRAPRQLTINRIFQELKRRLAHYDLPQPGMRGDADQMILCRNRDPEAVPVPEDLRKPPTGSPSLVLGLAPAAFAAHLRGADDGTGGQGAQGLLTDFVRRRTVSEIALLAAELAADEGPERAAVVAGHVFALREGDDFTTLVHLLHEQRLLGAGAVFELLDTHPVQDLVTVLGGLTASGCAHCERVAGSLARLPAAEWPVERLAGLLAALRGGPARDAGPAALRDAVLDALTTTRLSALAGHLWSTDDDHDAAPERRWDALGVIERAATEIPLTQLYETAVRLAGEGRRELGNVLLEFAADRRGPAEVAELLRRTEDDPDFARLVRRTTLHRHPPGYLADLLEALGAAGRPDATASRAALLDCAVDRVQGLSARDLARLLLLLHHGRGRDALDAALDAAAGHSDPEHVAETAAQLYRYAGTDTAGLLTGRLLRAGPEIDKAIGVLCLLHADRWTPLVDDMVDQAAGKLRLDHAFHMACVLAELALQPVARDLVHRTVLPSRATAPAASGTLADALDAFMANHKPAPEQLSWLLGAIAEPCPVDKAWELITWALRALRGGEASVLTAVCQVWPVARIEELADYLRRKNWDLTARQLMDHAVTVFAGDRPLGVENGELVMALRRQADRRTPRDAERRLVDGLVGRGDPTQVMMLIDHLADERAYDLALHKLVHDAVLRHFDADALVSLPAVRRAEHLRVVLDITQQALLNPSRVGPERVPAVLQALRDAGAPGDDLAAVCDFVGGRRRVDRIDVVRRLRIAGLGDEADAYVNGGRLRRKKFFDP